ncbi:hypothetical protein ACRALDRAFT_1095117 [Sodiomyces alcalophilus JCM 7366]|uniref:uncharacterized protein n=1 Tax=Sodiomyces alcalophilus JCM 7366 TaxID=591952 RepID=UPI0039B68983
MILFLFSEIPRQFTTTFLGMQQPSPTPPGWWNRMPYQPSRTDYWTTRFTMQGPTKSYEGIEDISTE